MQRGRGGALRFALQPSQFRRSLSYAAAGCSDEEGEPVVDLGADAVGTCLDFTDALDTVEVTVTRLPVVPCSEQHTHEIYEVLTVREQELYPGFEALESEAQARCLAPFEEYVGVSAFDSDLFFSWLIPTLNSWENDNDSEIVCVIGEGNGAPLPAGSVQGIAH